MAYPNDEKKRDGRIWAIEGAAKWTALGLIALVLFALFMQACTTVDVGTRAVVLKFGAPTGAVLDPGLHFIMPVAEKVRVMNVQTQIIKADEEASSHDLQVVHTQLTLGYYTEPGAVIYVLSQLNDDAAARVITPAMQEAVKALTARYDAEQLISKRPEVRDGIETFLRSRLTPHHILIDSLSITNFSFSHDFNQAIEAKVTAQQLAMKAQNDLQRIKVEADQKVAAAEGEAKALMAQKQQVTPELIQLRTVELLREKWDGRFPEIVMAGQGAFPLLDIAKGMGARR